MKKRLLRALRRLMPRRRALLVLAMVAIVGLVGMARTDFFDAVYIEGAFTMSGTSAFAITGTTFSVTASTSSALYSPTIYLGYDSGARINIAVTDTTGAVAITHTGSAATMGWTVPAWTNTNSTSYTNYTPSYVIGYDSGAKMTIAVSDTTGNVAITLTGSNKSFTVTAAGGFDLVGAIALDATTLSDVLTFSGGGTIDNTAADTMTLTETNIVLSGAGSATSFAVGGGYGSTGVSISAAGVIQANGAITTDGALTADSAAIGGGYGSTGASISTAGVGQFNGALTTDGALTADSAAIGGGYGSTGVSISNAGVIQADGAITSDGTITGGSLTDSTATLSGGDLSGAGTVTATTITDGTASLTSGDLTGLTSLELTGDFTHVGDVYRTGDTSQTGSITLFGSGGDLTVGDDAAVTGDFDVDGATTLDAVEVSENLQAAVATNDGAMFVSLFTITYAQTDSYTLCTIPANADVMKIEVATTTAFSGGSATTLNVGWSGTAQGYSSDLNIRSAGLYTGDEYANLGDIGGSNRDVTGQITTDDSAGACTIRVYWTMATPGTP